MRKPHGCHEAFASDITDREYKVALDPRQVDEIAREMTHGEYLTGNLIRTCAKIARAAESSLHLSGFVHGSAQIVVFVT
jgi:hypothetical protein